MFRSSHGRRWALAALVAALGGASAHAQTAACQINYTQAWGNGGSAHGVNLEIRNLGPAINGWTLTFAFPSGQTLQNGWPVTFTPSGANLTIASNASWNASIPTNGSFMVGFNANGAFAVPSAFRLNGTLCNSGTPTPVNTAPTISFTAPAAGATVTAGTALTVSVNAADTNTGGGIASVAFFLDSATTPFATDTSSPYSATLSTTGLASGSHTLRAVATDNGVPTPVMTATATRTFNIGTTTQNTAPTVSISAPTNGQIFAAGTTNVTINATAADTNTGGAINRVEFRNVATGALIASDTSSPYSASLAVANGQSYSVSATAFDNGAPTNTVLSAAATVGFSVATNQTTPSIQPTPTAVTVPGGGSTTAVVRLSAAPTGTVSVAVTRAAGGSTAITAAPATLSFNGTNWNTGLTVTISAVAGTGTATATFNLTATGHTAGAIAATRANTTGNALFRVNANGRITKNGALFPVHCGSWFGLEGRHEPSTDPVNPRGAAMEQYIGNTSWVNGGAGSGRTIAQTMTQISGMGMNVIRLPMVPQTLNANDPQGTGAVLKNHSSVRIANSRLAFETMIRAADAANIEVMLDVHSCSNYVGWRKGRFDARPPYADADRDNYDFKREDSSCAATNNPPGVTQISPYNTSMWLSNLQTLAGMSSSLGVDNIIGIDIFNEPHDFSWAEWKSLTEQAYATINATNPNILLFVQGIGTQAGKQDGTPATFTEQPHGVVATNPNWGENLFEAVSNPINVPKDRIVFSPHTYGPSVFVQKMFMDPAQTACTGLEGDAAGDADCRIVINPTLLRQGWEEHFGFLKQQGFAIVVGEFGGNLDWPQGQAAVRDRDRWSHITPGVDLAWQNAFVDYMVEKDIEGCYWSINPESGDTAGWYGHAYNPISNQSGWGEWQAFDARKTTLLNRLWQGVP